MRETRASGVVDGPSIAAEQILALLTALNGHDRNGASLAAPLAGWLGEWARTIAEHHERFDGSGYPYGLAGLGISQGGRIVTAVTVTATNSVGAGAPSPASNPTTPATNVGSMVIQNGSGISGRADQGDRIIITYSSAPSPASFRSGWTTSSQGDLTGSNVTVHGHHGSSGNNTIASITDSVDCAGGFHFGSIDLGQRGYVTIDINFSGSTIHWDSRNTLTITLGAPGSGSPTQNNPSVAVYTPDPALGISGTFSSGRATPF
jgi:hypothetical protein